MDIKLPDEVKYIINTLENAGYGAYAVGGCVRDSLLGKEPEDWDICTSALPEQTGKIFKGHNIIKIGLQHGTITIVINHKPFEVTAYRIDGVYSDNRHPDKVEFTGGLKEDLSRRDFTINAMAYSPVGGIVDFFGGAADLRRGLIKCVGDPDKRFAEDALRVMRALRFASTLGFSIDNYTARAMHENRGLLKKISPERITAELNKLIAGNDIDGLLAEHVGIIEEIIPELRIYAFKSVDSVPNDLYLRLAILLSGAGPGIAKDILTRLKYDNHTVTVITQLILYYEADIPPTGKEIKKWLSKIGEERLRQLIELKGLCAALPVLNEILEQKQCFSLKGLAVNGKDLIEAGVPEGAEIGAILNRLLSMVIDEEIENDKEKLLLEVVQRGAN